MARDQGAGRQLYIVLEDLAAQLPGLIDDLLTVSKSESLQDLKSVVSAYSKELDVALIAMEFAEELDKKGKARLIRDATAAGVVLFDPRRLLERDQQRFFGEYLQRFRTNVGSQSSLVEAVVALCRQEQLMDITVDRSFDEATVFEQVHHRAAGTLSDSSSSMHELRVLDTVENDVNVVSTFDTLGGTATPSAGPKVKPIAQDLPLVLARSPSMPSSPAVSGGVPDPTRSPESADDAADMEFELGPAGRPQVPAQAKGKKGKRKHQDRKPTVPGLPTGRSRLGSGDPQSESLMPRTARGSIPPRQPSPPPEGDEIRVQFQRGDRWYPARLRNLNTREARLAAGSAPPLGHPLAFSIGVGGKSLVLSGPVVEVINAERSVDGSTTFRVQLDSLQPAEKQELVALLKLARDLNLTLTPPPARRSRRFSISWPIQIVSEGVCLKADALDISDRGLFLATPHLLRSRDLHFGLPLDNEHEDAQGQAVVARSVSVEMAQERGLAAGYGIYIESISSGDSEKFRRFLDRVKARSQHHVLVAGSALRVHPVGETLRGIGYAVTTADGVAGWMQATHPSEPTIAIIDASLTGTSAHRLHARLAEREIPTLFLEGTESPLRARELVDRCVLA